MYLRLAWKRKTMSVETFAFSFILFFFFGEKKKVKKEKKYKYPHARILFVHSFTSFIYSSFMYFFFYYYCYCHHFRADKCKRKELKIIVGIITNADRNCLKRMNLRKSYATAKRETHWSIAAMISCKRHTVYAYVYVPFRDWTRDEYTTRRVRLSETREGWFTTKRNDSNWIQGYRRSGKSALSVQKISVFRYFSAFKNHRQDCR